LTENSKVFVTQRPIPNKKNGWTPDLSPATSYGRLEYVFESDKQVFCTTAKSLERAKDFLEDFNPDRDFLLWPNSGDPAALWVCIHALAGMGLPCVKYLYWERGFNQAGERDSKKGFYSPITIDF
jgi:hypothetical protein